MLSATHRGSRMVCSLIGLQARMRRIRAAMHGGKCARSSAGTAAADCAFRAAGSTFRGSFNEGDFFGREAIEFVNEFVDLVVGGIHRVLKDAALLFIGRGAKLGSQCDHLLHECDNTVMASTVPSQLKVDSSNGEFGNAVPEVFENPSALQLAD